VFPGLRIEENKFQPGALVILALMSYPGLQGEEAESRKIDLNSHPTSWGAQIHLRQKAPFQKKVFGHDLSVPGGNQNRQAHSDTGIAPFFRFRRKGFIGHSLLPSCLRK
jgi:hypothetical protein